MIVLMYHCVYRNKPEETGFQNTTAFTYKLSAEQFEKQVIAISDYLSENNISKDYVVFTFDDGGVSFFTVCKPILEKYGFKGVFFIATKFIGTHGFMTPEQIKLLSDAGHVIGSHSHNHPERMDILTTEALMDEWSESYKTLNAILGKDISVASIPNGYSSKKVLNTMMKVGYKTNYTSKPTTRIKKVGDSHIIGRYAITKDMSTENVLKIVSSNKRRFMMETRDAALSIAKAILGDTYLTIRKKILSK